MPSRLSLPQALALDLGLLLIVVAVSAWTGSWTIVTVYFLFQFARVMLRLDWRADVLAPYLSLRPYHVLLAGAVAAVGVLAAFGLAELAERWPLTAWSWLWLFDVPGQNLVASGLTGPPYIALAYAVALMIVMPRIVLAEEWLFRRGTKGVGNAIFRSFVFGIVHMAVGVPLSVAVLVLPVVGMVLSWEYLRAFQQRLRQAWPLDFPPPPAVVQDAEHHAIRASGLIHLAFNTWVIALVLALMLAGQA